MPYDLHKQPITHTYPPRPIYRYPTHFSISYSFLDKSIIMQQTILLHNPCNQVLERTNTILYNTIQYNTKMIL
jgi:hypothetical protein